MKQRIQQGSRWGGTALAALACCTLLLSLLSSALAQAGLLQIQDDPSQWVMSGRTYSRWNYSPLDQINLDNVDQLQVAWTFQTGVLDAHEAEPLVVGDMMYIVTPKPNTVYALDLTRQG
ncbi:MAG TPA: hypothetical protein VF171_05960, partial [Trueperaceae bacterium]